MKYALAQVYPTKKEANEVADRWRDRYYMRVQRLKRYNLATGKAKVVYGVYQGDRKKSK